MQAFLVQSGLLSGEAHPGTVSSARSRRQEVNCRKVTEFARRPERRRGRIARGYRVDLWIVTPVCGVSDSLQLISDAFVEPEQGNC
jgi:hypothetical protein